MLILTRKENESITLQLDDNIDPTTPIGELISHPITIQVSRIKGRQVSFGLDAPGSLVIFRPD